MDGKYLIGTITILVVVVLVGSVIVPIIDMSTNGGVEYEDNPDWDGWVRFALDKNAGTTYSLSYTEDENGFYIDNSTDRQTYDDSSTSGFDTILYADSNLSVWIDGAIHVLGTNEGDPIYLEGNGALTIVRDADGVTVTPEGEEPLTFGVPTWAYIPVSTGNYGFYLASNLDSELGNGVKNYPNDMPLAVVGGGFAGVYAYNNIFRYDGLGLAMQPIYDDDGLFYGASWDRTATVDTQNEEPTDLIFDPSVIQPIDDPFNTGMGLMAVPTPTYTDGVWGYDLITVDNVQKAVIVSYSGAGGDIVVPATVGGYDVYRVGKTGPNDSGSSAQVIDNASISSNSTITFPEGIKEFGKYAFFQCNKLQGSLVIPESVTYIGDGAFYNCRFNNTLTIPESVTYIGSNAFRNCYFTGSLVIPDSITSIEGFAFNSWTYATGTLVIPESVTSINQYAFAQSKFTGTLVIPESVTSLGYEAFGKCTGFTGTLVIPESVTSISDYVFNDMTGIDSVVISSDAIPTAGIFYRTTGITEVLDLSDTVDYSVDRNGLADSVTVSDSIGDCFGFISIVSIPHGTPGVLGAYSPLFYAIPVLIFAALLIAVAAVALRRYYY